MKSYHEYLKQGVLQSDLTLAEISNKLKEKGFLTKSSYLSRLQNGKIPPAKDELNKALAAILNLDQDQLILKSYIEKAPDEFKSLISKADMLDSLINNAIRTLLVNIPIDSLLSSQDRNFFSNQGYDVDNFERFMSQIEEEMDLITKWQLYEYLTKQMTIYEDVNNNGNLHVLIDMTSGKQTNLDKTKSHNSQSISIPFFTKMYTHQQASSYLDSYETYTINDEHQPIPDAFNIFLTQSLDDGMNFDGIQAKDKLLVFNQEPFEHTDILLIAIDDQPAVFRRLQHDDDKCIVRPSNPAYKIEYHPTEDITILGKAIEVWKKVKL